MGQKNRKLTCLGDVPYPGGELVGLVIEASSAVDAFKGHLLMTKVSSHLVPILKSIFA